MFSISLSKYIYIYNMYVLDLVTRTSKGVNKFASWSPLFQTLHPRVLKQYGDGE